MEFHQKKGKNEIKITLNSDHLIYFIKDDSSKGEFTIEYDSLSSDMYEFTEKNIMFKNYSIYLLVIGIIFGVARFLFNAPSHYYLFLIGSLIVYIIYLKSIIKYTILEADRKIYIIQDKNHDTIINRIFEARKNLIKEKYGQIDFNNDKLNEVKKFKWLLNQKIITDQEFNEISAEIYGKN